MRSHLAASITIAFALSISMPWAAEAVDPVSVRACQGFNEGNSVDPTEGFGGSGITLSIQKPGPSGKPQDLYLHTEDKAGTSYITASKLFLGDYTHLPQCAGICFDVRLFNDGSGADGQAPHSQLTPTIQLFSGSTLSALFTAAPTLYVAEDVGWRHVCAPVGPLSSTGALPNSLDGSWKIIGGTNSDWPTILSNVTEIRLTGFDVTMAATEKAGYDNFCIQGVGGCYASINKDIKNNTGQPADNLEISVVGEFLTVDWHYDGNPGEHVASSFAFTTTPGNLKLLTWSGITPPVPPGDIFHAGFRVSALPPDFPWIYGLSWTSGGTFIGDAHQVNSGVQFPGDAPVALFTNNVGQPPFRVPRRHVSNISVEWFVNEVPLDQLNATASRMPIRRDTFGPLSLDLAPGTRASHPFPLAPPANARFGMLRYTVTGPSLAGQDQTIDFVQFGIDSPSATSIPTLGWWGTMLFVLLVSGTAVWLIGRRRRLEARLRG